ncbi:ribonuclease 3 isoform X2 [Copidosoma floridanum]|nr:ribonuclease 3 isoform X2 [Copidosoma floridanum]XP_014213272.1 ribonuclease 3 isoform X2 [Copidosoma floridanum]XP_014213280.1 ribonuclease 3 isoform X2 [Copidosoma floridanum]XP_014213290.1 ribonuclease 3 isoform X2 [Copidosoma floridanum]
MTIARDMDNASLNKEYQHYWENDSARQAQNYSYNNTSGAVAYDPSTPPPPLPYAAPATNYGTYNYSYPSMAADSTYANAYPNYNYQANASYRNSMEYQSHTQYAANHGAAQNSQYYSNYAQTAYNYAWNPNGSYQTKSKTDSPQWIASDPSTWPQHNNSQSVTVTSSSAASASTSASSTNKPMVSITVNNSMQFSSISNNSIVSKHKSTNRERKRSSSPENKYRSSKYVDRKKFDEHSSRFRARSKEKRRSRERSIRRRSRSSDRKSYSNNNSYSSRRNEKSNRRSRSISRSSSSRGSTTRNNVSRVTKNKPLTEREVILKKYRSNYCETRDEITKKIKNISTDVASDKKIWTRSSPADLYYQRSEADYRVVVSTEREKEICDDFQKLLVERSAAARALQPPYEPPPRKTKTRICRHKSEACSSSSESDESDNEDRTMKELMNKQLHPHRLHPEMWFNDPGEMNDGPLCRCSAKSRRSGIRHGIYAGEKLIEKCNPNTNNADRLYHYRITISPPTNFLTKTPTIIDHDEHEFIFEGFSMFSHFPLTKLPTCKVIRFNIEYTILYIEEKMPENFTVRELDLIYEYLFKEVLELVDFELKIAENKDGCSQFHFMPRFVRDLPDNGQEILSMNEVLRYLIKSSELLINSDELSKLLEMPRDDWQNFADEVKGMVVTYPGKKPCSIRVDQLDRNENIQPPKDQEPAFPEIVHFGIRPPQLSYAGNTDYQKAWRDYVKFRHLLANMPKPSFEDKRKLESKENKLQELRTQSKMKRDVTVDVSSRGFYRTGIMCDIVQHAMLIPVLVCHLRFHNSLHFLEKTINYQFKNRYLLQLALTHPSYRENFGTNPDHARNSLTNCGIRQPEYGDRRIHYMNTRKRGINTLINIMSRFGAKKETESSIAHNERLEFLGDAVVEFLTSIHLFHMFPDLEEGGLATYRAAIVQNQHLAVLAKKLNLDQYMLYAHGSDLCHDLELRHAMANCFEALMGALFLDGGIKIADTVFGDTLFKDESQLLNIWVNYPRHPLQEQEPTGDRQWIPSFELLQKLTKFEDSIGVEFLHIRLLARAFTDRSIGYTNLTLGSNQRLEFLGDTVLQLIVSEYLYKYFPEHHEGHLSLLRSSLVNNKTQAVVCDDLGMTQYAVYGNPKADLKTKDRADLLEAFLGALYVDRGLDFCQVFCDVCFFPRLRDFIMNQDWNDPKSKLQQCCLTLRTMDGGEPDIPVYKVVECIGPTNTRVYTVAVYFQGKRLATASGHSIQEAEMNSAKEALEKSKGLFPQLDHQKRVIAKSMKMQNWQQSSSSSKYRAIQSSKQQQQRQRQEDRQSDGGSDNTERGKRRSRSRERDPQRRSRSRERYDSTDRRQSARHDSSRSPETVSNRGRSPKSTRGGRSDSPRRSRSSRREESESLRLPQSKTKETISATTITDTATAGAAVTVNITTTTTNFSPESLKHKKRKRSESPEPLRCTRRELSKSPRRRTDNSGDEYFSSDCASNSSDDDSIMQSNKEKEAEHEANSAEVKGLKRSLVAAYSSSEDNVNNEDSSNDTNVSKTDEKSDLPTPPEKKIKTKL